MTSVLSGNQALATTSFFARLAAVLLGAGLSGILSSRATLAVLLILAVACYLPMPERQACWFRALKAAKSVYGFWVLIIFVAWLPNVFASPVPDQSFEAVIRTCLLVGLATLLWSIVVHDRSLYRITILSFLGTFALLISIVFIGHYLVPEVYGLIRGRGWDHTPVAPLLKAPASAVALFIPLLTFISVLFLGWRKLIPLVLIASCLLLVWVTKSHAALAGLIGGLLAAIGLVLLSQMKINKALITIVLFISLLVGVVYGLKHVLPERNPPDSVSVTTEDLFISTSLVDWHRQIIWKYVWSDGANNRWFGKGANAIDKLPSSKLQLQNTNIHFVPLHPHNWLVELITETGIIGVTAIILGIVIFIFQKAREFRATGDVALLTVVSLWAVYWSAGLFNFSFWSAWWLTCFLVSTAICLAGRGRVFMKTATSVRP